MGKSLMRRRTIVTCATVNLFRRSPTSRAFATSNGQIDGVMAETPVVSRSRISSVPRVPSSGKHHASATEASSTNRLISSAFIDQFAQRQSSQACPLSDFSDLADYFLQVLLFGLVVGNQSRHRNSAARNPNRFASGNFSQKFVQVSLRLEGAHSLHNN